MKNKAGIFFLSCLIPLFFFLVSMMTINDYGETTDEKFDQHIGEWYYNNWASSGIEGLKERFIPLQRNYGPFFDVMSILSHDYLSNRYQLLSSVASYHVPVIIVSTIVIGVVFWFGYLEGGLMMGLLASLILALMPRFIGDSQNNLKDTPLMTFFSLSLFFYYLAAKKKSFLLSLLAGLFTGLTYAIKINGLIILPIVLLWHMLDTRLFDVKKHLSFGLNFIASLCIALVTILLVWPYYRYDTINRFIETYFTFKDHVWNEYVLYLGSLYRGQEMPWHYPVVMLAVTMPTFFLILLILGIFLATRTLIKKGAHTSWSSLILLWLILPPLTQVISGAPMYDGIRHFLVALPPIALLIAKALSSGFLGLRMLHPHYRKPLMISYGFMLFLAFVSILLTNIRYHPYQIVYFNHLVGGVKGAYGKFDLDYWGQSLKEAAEWINLNLPTGSRILMAVPMEHHFPIDRTRFEIVDQDPDYKVVIIRGMTKDWDPIPDGDFLYPNHPPIYSINVDGGDILRMYQYPLDSKR